MTHIKEMTLAMLVAVAMPICHAATTFDTIRFDTPVFSETDVFGFSALTNTQSSIAAPFDRYKAYQVGDLCFYTGVLYRCKSSHYGSWLSLDWEQTSLDKAKVSPIVKTTLSGSARYDDYQTFGIIKWTYYRNSGELSISNIAWGTSVTVSNAMQKLVSNDQWNMIVFPNPDKWHYGVTMSKRNVDEDTESTLTIHIDTSRQELETLQESIDREVLPIKKAVDGVASITNDLINATNNLASNKVDAVKKTVLSGEEWFTPLSDLFGNVQWTYDTKLNGGSLTVKSLMYTDLVVTVTNGESGVVSNSACRLSVFPRQGKRHYYVDMEDISASLSARIQLDIEDEYETLDESIAKGVANAGWTGEAKDSVSAMTYGFIVGVTNEKTSTTYSYVLHGNGLGKSFADVIDFCRAQDYENKDTVERLFNAVITNDFPLFDRDRGCANVGFKLENGYTEGISVVRFTVSTEQAVGSLPSSLGMKALFSGSLELGCTASAHFNSQLSYSYEDVAVAGRFIGNCIDSNGVYGAISVTFNYSSGNGSPSGITNVVFTPIISTDYSKLAYAEVKSLCNTGNLVPGHKYQITNYVATTTQTGTQSANHTFDIIVTAISTNALSEEAKAALHAGDTYFPGGNCNLSAWKVWYSINNDTKRFAWADPTNGKGVIYRLIDEYGNDVPYDFKGIMFQKKIPFYDTSGVATQTNSVWCYTFDGGWSQQGARREMDFSIDDAGYSNFVFGNKIRPYIVEVTSGGYYLQQKLNGIVTLGYNVEENFFDEGCHDIILGQKNSSSANVIKNNFGKGCFANEFGAFFIGNEVKSQANLCRYVFTGTPSGSSLRTMSNTIGEACSGIVLSRHNSLNTIENGCVDITLAENVNNVNIANGSERITIGHDSSGINIGANVEDVNLGANTNGHWRSITIAPGVHNLDITKSDLNKYGQNFTVLSGTYGASSNQLSTVTVDVNTSHHVEYKPQGSTSIEVPVSTNP